MCAFLSAVMNLNGHTPRPVVVYHRPLLPRTVLARSIEKHNRKYLRWQCRFLCSQVDSDLITPYKLYRLLSGRAETRATPPSATIPPTHDTHTHTDRPSQAGDTKKKQIRLKRDFQNIRAHSIRNMLEEEEEGGRKKRNTGCNSCWISSHTISIRRWIGREKGSILSGWMIRQIVTIPPPRIM